MKTIMDYFLMLVMAIACVVALGGLVYMVGDYARCAPPAAPAKPQTVRVLPVVSCAPDGVAITTEVALRFAVTQLDVTLMRGRDVQGRRATPLDVSRMAEAIAAEFPAPDVALAMLDRCEPALRETHAHGYGYLTSALVRAAVAQRKSTVVPRKLGVA
jgi:hypothetical protein